MIHAFFYGVILAFGLIIPLGVQNIFIFNQGARHHNLLHALPSVLSASLCDTVLILCAVLGVSVAVLTLPWLKLLIFIIGFFFLLYISWITWNSAPANLSGEATTFSALRQIKFACSVSLLNPHALLDTIGVIGTNSLNFSGKEKWIYTFACIFVSFCWFFALSIAGHFLHKIDKQGIWIRLVNKISAVVIFAVAIYIGWQLIRN